MERLFFVGYAMSGERHILKRLAKSGNKFGRPQGRETLRPRIIIVCEGEKTEPNYFEDLIQDCRLTSADVAVYGEECDSAPASIVDFAEDIYRKNKGAAQRIFCVFDRDRHETFDAAVTRIAGKRNLGFTEIISYPCFEYWLLLHFSYSRKEYIGTAKKSPGDIVVKELEKIFNKDLKRPYKKGLKGVYSILKNRINDASKRATMACQDAHQTNNPNPSTNVLDLINFLRSQGNPPKDSLPIN